MANRNYMLALAIGFVCLGLSSPSAAQNLPRRYQPSRPTISPYLNLFRPEIGPLPNYYTFVRPQLDQQALNQFQSKAIYGNTKSISQLAQQAQQPLTPGAVPTGTASQFMTLSHFYPRATAAPPAPRR